MAARAVLILAALLAAMPAVAPAAPASRAVVLVYHHVASDTPASTSLEPGLFARHLEFLAAGGHTVLPLGTIAKPAAKPAASATAETTTSKAA